VIVSFNINVRKTSKIVMLPEPSSPNAHQPLYQQLPACRFIHTSSGSSNSRPVYTGFYVDGVLVRPYNDRPGAFPGYRCNERALAITMLKDKDGYRRLRSNVSLYLLEQPFGIQVARVRLIVAIFEAAKHAEVSFHVRAVYVRTELLDGRTLSQLCGVCDCNLLRG
jgi:hypothetical protein